MYYPDVPADKTHTREAGVVTHSRAFYIFETTPDCNGTIIGADFCYRLENTTRLQLSRVFEYAKLEVKGDNIFTLAANSTVHRLSAIHLDHTRCEPQQDNSSNCCQRMTMRGEGLRLVEGTSLVLGILIENVDMSYPLLQFGEQLEQYHVQARVVDLNIVKYSGSVFNGTFDASNTNGDPVSLPILRFVVRKSTACKLNHNYLLLHKQSLTMWYLCSLSAQRIEGQ